MIGRKIANAPKAMCDPSFRRAPANEPSIPTHKSIAKKTPSSVQPMPATRRGSGLGCALGLRGADLRGAALRFGAAFAAVARVFFGASLVDRERVATIGSTPPVGVLLP